MALSIEETVSLLSASAAELLPKDAIRRAQNVDRIVGPDGSVNLGAPRFYPITTDDGTVRRLKCAANGTLYTTEEP